MGRDGVLRNLSFPGNGIQQGTVRSAQPALGIECRRAAAGCGGDCLAVAAVDEVAGGEYALRGGTGRTAFGQDVATGIEVDVSDQEIRAGIWPTATKTAATAMVESPAWRLLRTRTPLTRRLPCRASTSVEVRIVTLG